MKKNKLKKKNPELTGSNPRIEIPGLFGGGKIRRDLEPNKEEVSKDKK